MIPSADPSNPQYSMIPQLTTQMSALHLGTGSVSFCMNFEVHDEVYKSGFDGFWLIEFDVFQYITASPHPYPYSYPAGPSIIHTMPLGDSEQTSNAASPDDSYQQYQPQQPK